MPERSSFGRRLALVLAFGLGASAGCGDEFGPERMPTADVTGQLTLRGQPIGRGWLEFLPVGGTVGVLRSPRLRSDGTFHDGRLPVGRVAIRLVGADIPATGDPRLDRFLVEIGRVFLIERDVPGRPKGPLVIDLGLEAIHAIRADPGA